MFSLPCIPFFHATSHLGDKLVVLESPARNGEERRRGLGDKTFEDEVWTKTLDEVDDKIDVFVSRKEMEVVRTGSELFCHLGTFDELQLVEFQHGERQV